MRIDTVDKALQILPKLDPEQFRIDNYAGTFDRNNQLAKADISELNKNCTPLGWQTTREIQYDSIWPYVVLCRHTSGFIGWMCAVNITIMDMAERYQQAQAE